VRYKAALMITIGFLSGCRTLGGEGATGDDASSVGFSTNPEEARIITTDIDHFWRAFAEATPMNDVRVYQEEYLGRGTAGLREFTRLKIGNARNLAARVWTHARYYASVRSSTLAIHAEDRQIRENYRRLQALYPEALFPDLYFLIGPMTSGGISTNRGIIVGAELFTETASSPVDELNAWEMSAVRPMDKIPLVVAHELIHFQQRFQKDPETLLERSIAEGSADFLSEIIAGAQINELQHSFGEQHEHVLWNEFRQVMNGKDYSRWLYNGAAFAFGNNSDIRPADMGYYIGYKICQAYYEQAADKKRAIKDIIQIEDFSQFLKESHYELRLAATQAPNIYSRSQSQQ
jgi:hypothetical protein